MEGSDFITCGYCEDLFNFDTHAAILIPCGHTVCKKCLSAIWKHLHYIKCPFDLTKHYNDLETYPRNFLAVQLIDKYSEEYKIKSKQFFLKFCIYIF